MFPLLPAILLLILQGPSSIERMALDGRLPAALDAISRQMETGTVRTANLSRADEAVLATFLSFSGNPGVSHALYTLLGLDGGCEQPPQDPPACERNAIDIEGWLPDICAGFNNCQRSRDGPL